MAPMASLDPKVKTCSKTCLNNYETLKKQYDDLLAKQLQTKFESTTYKRGLDTVEAQLVTYRKNEVLFSEEGLIRVWIRHGKYLLEMVLQYTCRQVQKTHVASYDNPQTRENEIASLKRRVKKLEKKSRSRTHKLKRLYKVGLTAMVESSRDEESLGQNKNVVEEVVDAAQVSTAATTVTITTEEITLAQALEALKTSKPKDKGKGILIEPVEPIKKKDLIRLDEEAKIDVDHQLAKRLQAQEQEELSIEEKATLFQQLLEKRRKYFTAKRAEEKRNKPPTKAQ
ncbi:hypothetical protein Tco_1459487 [Tanacetum coccineum]